MGLVAKAFQDIITFSRASSGTYVNSNGYITNSSVLNYLTYSNQPENAAWTKSNSFVQQNLLTYSEFPNGVADAPTRAGLLTATSLANYAGALAFGYDGVTTTYAYKSFTNSGSTNYAISVIVKMTDGNAPAFGSSTAANVANDFVLIVGTDPVNPTTYAVTNLGSGVYRVFAAITTPSVPTGANNGVVKYNTNSNRTFIVTGYQLVQGSVPGDYRATTSAALPCLYADYNGALRARKLCEDATAAVQHRINQTTAFVGGSGTYFIKAKAGERQYVSLRTNTVGAAFDLVSGAITVSGVTASTANLGNGWWLCVIYNPAAAANEIVRVNIENAFAVASAYAGDGSSGIYIADAQLNDGSSALAYYDTSASAYNAPRFDYDPVTLAAKGLLVEEQRANLLLQSNDFQTSWTTSNITRTLNSTLSPDGNVNGVKIETTAVSTFTALYQQVAVAATSATGSGYAKQGTSSTVANTFTLRNVTTAVDLIKGTLNYSTGVFTYTTGSTGVVVTNAGNGWWRIAVTATTGITSGDVIRWGIGFNGTSGGTSEFLYAYGAQLEAGAFATSYIPTTASQVTRGADVASVNTLSPWFNSVAGTLYAEWDYVGDGSTSNPNTRTTVGISDGTSNNRFQIYNIGGNTGGLIQTGGVTQAALDAGATTAANTIVKGALAYATNDAAYSRNGGAPSTDVSVTLPTVNVMYLGTEPASQRLSGHLRRITYYPRRLTNAELQTLTTL